MMMTGHRRKSREHAMQTLFYMDMVGNDSNQGMEMFYDHFHPAEKAIPFSRTLVAGVKRSQHLIDTTIERFSNNWKIHRMPHVDRNILRIAVFEMMYVEDIPLKVSINEAIDIAKKFGTDESGPFINGILDSLRIAIESGAMNIPAENEKDSLELRCPRLGGPITFKYCRQGGEEQKPCFKIMDCWWETFDVKTYLENILSESDFKALMNAKPPDKINSLIDLIEQAKQMNKT
jgi:N utilization substance protein B